MNITRKTPLYLLAIIIAVYIFQANRYWHYINDDAYITFRYSVNLAQGIGPYFNEGEYVEGYSNFSWMVVMAFIGAVFGSAAIPVGAKIIGALLGGLTIGGTWFLCRKALCAVQADAVRASLWGCCAAGVVAVSPGFVLNCVSGLETACFSFLLIAAALLCVFECSRKAWYGSGLAFALIVLTRPEGVLFFAVTAAVLAGFTVFSTIRECREGYDKSTVKIGDHLKRQNLYRSVKQAALSPLMRIVLINCGIILFVVCSQFLFRYFFYETELLPNTYYAKKGGFWKTTPLHYLYDGLLLSTGGPAGFALCVAGFVRSGRMSVHVPVCGAFVVSAVLLVLLTGTGWMPGERIVIPVLPQAAVIAVIGWFFVFECFRLPVRWLFLIIAGILGILWFYSDGKRDYFHNETILRATGYQTGHFPLARWLDENTHPGGTVAVMDTGIVGFTCRDLRILDITGLTDRHIAKSRGGFLNKQYDVTYVLNQKPEHIVLTLYTKGIPYKPPPAGSVFSFWTLTEKKYYDHPLFKKHYIRKRDMVSGETNWLKNLACSNGADIIFEHGHPQGHYLLAVFSRNDYRYDSGG